MYTINPSTESENDQMILMKGMVNCYLPVGTPFDKSSEWEQY